MMITALVLCIGIFLLSIKLNKKFKVISNLSYSIAFSVRAFCFASVSFLALQSFAESLTVLVTSYKENIFGEVIKIMSINIGLAFVWYTVFTIFSNIFYNFSFGNSNEKIELEKNNYTYFLTKGALTFTIFILSGILFEGVLRLFTIEATASFYN